jgi:hypothetical protein
MPILLCLLVGLLAMLPFALLYWLLALKPPVTSYNPTGQLFDSKSTGRTFRWRRLKTVPELPTHSCPVTVVELAQAFIQGQDCGFALHDAMLDAGFTDLAEDFRASRYNPNSLTIQAILENKPA